MVEQLKDHLITVSYTIPNLTNNFVSLQPQNSAEAKGQKYTDSYSVEKPALRMAGLPYSVTEGDIVEFFHGFGLIEESIKIGKYSNGKTTGEAVVLFENG